MMRSRTDCRQPFIFLLMLVALTLSRPVFSQDEDASATNVRAQGKTVFVLPLEGPIDKSLMIVFRRAFRDIASMKPDAVIIEIDTPGGGLLETEEIIAWMRSLDVPIYAYVNIHAQSAGAIVSFGTDAIYMAPGSRIGSALPIIIQPGGGGVVELPEDVQEKILSDTRALVRGLAQENGHWEDIAIAMVDRDREVKVGDVVISARGELLNLTAEEAVKVIPPRTEPVLAREIVPDIDALLDHVGLADAEKVFFTQQPAEVLARYIVMIGPVLFALGLLGIFIEVRTPGFGVPGIAGIILLAIYFFGHYVAGLAGMEDLVLVTIGFLLLALEVFVIPGFGIAGILGIVFIFAGTVMAMVPFLPTVPEQLPDFEPSTFIDYLEGALWRLFLIVVTSGIGVVLLSKILPRTSAYRRLVLEKVLDQGSGYVSGDDHHDYVGQIGVAQTALRPSGIAMFGSDRVDVVSTGELIAKGASVRVVQVQGSRVVVEIAKAAAEGTSV